MKSAPARPSNFIALLPQGQGVMLIEEDGEHYKISASAVDYISADEDEVYIYCRNGKYYIRLLEIQSSVIEDMYLRALRGEIARSAEYNKEGQRLDGSPLILKLDFEAKRMALQRRIKNQRVTVTISPSKANEGELELLSDDKGEVDDVAALEFIAQQEAQEANESEESAQGLQVPALLRDKASLRDAEETAIPELHKIGELIENKGVYIGTYTHEWMERDGMLSEKVPHTRLFDVFAASHDIADENGRRLVANFNNLLSAIARIENMHGHAGVRIDDALSLNKLMQDANESKRLGGWFVPNIDMMANNIHLNRGKGVLAKTFCVEAGQASFWKDDIMPSSYISLTYGGDGTRKVLDFDTGIVSKRSTSTLMTARPIRMEPRG